MKIKIAVFGRTDMINQLQGYANIQSDVQIVPFEYIETEEVTRLVEQAFMCDIYVFLEALPYLYVKDYLDKKRLPAIKVTLDEYMILTTFYRIKSMQHKPLNRFSLDVFDKEHVDEVLAELHMQHHEIYTYGYIEHPPDLNKVIHFHLQLWNDNKIDYVLTSIKEVKDRLTDTGIPATFMQVPKVNLLDVIDKAKSMITLNQNESSQIVTGYVQIKHNDNRQKSKKTITDQLHNILQNFCHKTNSTVLLNKENQFILVGTRGMLDHITNHYRNFPLLTEIKQNLDIDVDVGFGLGLTAKQSDNHAKIALKICRENKIGCSYIVNDRQETIGPLGVKKEFNTSRLYQALIHQARLNNELSYNFIKFITKRNNAPFSSHDIARFYNVTKRSAERTINKLLTGKVIKIVGEEKPYTRGRPRKLFQINV